MRQNGVLHRMQKKEREFDGAINLEPECKCEKDLVENDNNQAYFSYSKTLHKGIVSLKTFPSSLQQ